MKRILSVAAVAIASSTASGGAKLHEESVTYTGGGATMKGQLFYDESQTGKKPAVLVVHEWWGNNDYSRMRARKFAELGYVALAVDMYGDGKQADTPTDAGKLAGSVLGNPDVALARLTAGLDVLKKNDRVDPGRMIAVGYCFGGGVVLAGARGGLDLKAVGSFHGSLATKTPATAGVVKAKVFVANGAADPLVKPEDVAGLDAEMKAANVYFELVQYPGALHAFTNPKATELGKKFSMPSAYNAAADEKSWRDFQAFVTKALK
jgi:dienelactone hydrolase